MVGLHNWCGGDSPAQPSWPNTSEPKGICWCKRPGQPWCLMMTLEADLAFWTCSHRIQFHLLERAGQVNYLGHLLPRGRCAACSGTAAQPAVLHLYTTCWSPTLNAPVLRHPPCA